MRETTIEAAKRAQDFIKSGKTMAEACNKAGISSASYQRWLEQRESTPEIAFKSETKRMTENKSIFDDFAFSRLTRNVLKLSIPADEKIELIEQLAN